MPFCCYCAALLNLGATVWSWMPDTTSHAYTIPPALQPILFTIPSYKLPPTSTRNIALPILLLQRHLLAAALLLLMLQTFLLLPLVYQT
jgi:hypothetical protein